MTPSVLKAQSRVLKAAVGCCMTPHDARVLLNMCSDAGDVKILLDTLARMRKNAERRK